MELSEKLIKEVEAKRPYFKIDNFSMSIGELYNLYKNNEIIIRPEYQRLFRWSNGQRVKLIESILLGIPLPAIFVYQDENGIWELVDGLQRVSTILQFMGILQGEDPLQLNGTKYLPSLDGYIWEAKKEGDLEIPESIKLAFKRSKLNLTIILSESDPRAKFEIFQRLNTGGSNASNQEIRNNIMIMIKPNVFTWFEKLSKNPDFINTLSLSDRLLDEQYNLELLLRFISLYKFPYDNKKDLGDYLDNVNELMLEDTDFPFGEIEQVFSKTFKLLNDLLGEKTFKKFDGNDFKGKFLESAFESIALGIAYNINDYLIPQDSEILKDKIKQLYSKPQYNEVSGSGSNARTRIPRLTTFAKDYFKKDE